MGMHLTSGALNQAALARNRARASRGLLAGGGGGVPRLDVRAGGEQPAAAHRDRLRRAPPRLLALRAVAVRCYRREARRSADLATVRPAASRRSPGRPRPGRRRRRSPSRRRTRSPPPRGSAARCRVDATVDLERRVLADDRAQARDLVERVLDERLPAPAGVDGHAQRHVDRVRDLGRARRRGSRG